MIANVIAIWRYAKIAGAIVLVGLVVNYVKEARYAKKDNKRLKENYDQRIRFDSIKYSEESLTKDEFIQEMNYNNQELVERLDRQDIKLNRISRLTEIKHNYRDTTARDYDLSKILEAIYAQQPIKQEVVDSTECHVIKGYIHFDGKDLELNINEREFSDITNIVVHKEKVGARFWKWFRKKKVSVTVLNSCGETTTRMVKVSKK